MGEWYLNIIPASGRQAGFVNSTDTVLFTKPPAELFAALPGTIPEKL